MTSIGPYSQKTDATYMFNFTDIHGPFPKKIENPNSISDVICNNSCFSKFKYILNLSKLDGIYNDIQANFTIFVTSDDFLKYIPESVFVNMDLVTSRNIIQASTLENRITSEILKDSKCSFFTTMNQYNRLSVKNMNNNTILNNNINVIQTDIICTNGIIHIIDSLIIPKIQI